MTEIDLWFTKGAEVQEGLRLLAKYSPNSFLDALVRQAPERYSYLLKSELSKLTTIDITNITVKSYRQEYPFLQDPSCPYELKILATDKITAYRNFASYHAKLFDCNTLQDCLETAKKVIKFYTENCKIFSEFKYYAEHKHILGKHPIFKELNERKKLRKCGLLELIKKEKNIKNSIWRLKARIAKGDRPDLDIARSSLIELKEKKLHEVDNLIKEYGRE